MDDSDELKIILDLLNKNFRNKVYNTSYEWGAGIGMDGECQKTYSNWLRNKVFLSEILLDAAKNKGILTIIHSHPFTTSPLASFKDYELFAKNKVKYGIVTNEFGMMIIKNKNVAANYQNSKTINDVAMDIEFQIKTDFEEKLGNQGINPDSLSEERYISKFQKYVRHNHDNYLDIYKEELKNYFNITFI